MSDAGEANKALIRRLLEDAFNDKASSIDQHVANDYTGHLPLAGTLHGPADLKCYHATFHRAYPGARIVIHDLLAERSMVAVHWTIEGIPYGQLRAILTQIEQQDEPSVRSGGMPKGKPNERRMALTGMNYFHICDDKVQESWSSVDYLGLLQQRMRHAEEPTLRRQSGRAIGWLVVCLLVSLTVCGIVLRMTPETTTENAWQIIALSIAAGTLGSSITALESVINRRANGWEFSNGDKSPPGRQQGKDDKREMFGERIHWGFYVRPFYGAAIGFLVYLGVIGGYLLTAQPVTEPASTTLASGSNGATVAQMFNPHGLTFLALLGGLAAKTLVERLKATFKAFLGGS